VPVALLAVFEFSSPRAGGNRAIVVEFRNLALIEHDNDVFFDKDLLDTIIFDFHHSFFDNALHERHAYPLGFYIKNEFRQRLASAIRDNDETGVFSTVCMNVCSLFVDLSHTRWPEGFAYLRDPALDPSSGLKDVLDGFDRTVLALEGGEYSPGELFFEERSTDGVLTSQSRH
jgi:hypothetical protein